MYKTTDAKEAMKLQKENRPLVGYAPPESGIETWTFADEVKISALDIARKASAKAETEAAVAESNARASRSQANKLQGALKLAETEADDLEDKAEELRDVADKAKKKIGKPEDSESTPASRRTRKTKNK